MMDVTAIDQTLFAQVPFAQHVGAHVTAVSAESAQATLPAAHERLNHVGTVHAVAQFGLGEVASGGVVLAAFTELMAEGYAPIAASATIKYVRPGRGELRAVSRFAMTEQQAARAQIAEAGKARFTVPVQIFDSADQLISEMTVEWVLLKYVGG